MPRSMPPTRRSHGVQTRTSAPVTQFSNGTGKNLEVFSPTIGRQLLELGLIDEIDLHTAPILLGEGIRLYDDPGSEPIRLHPSGQLHRAVAGICAKVN